MSEPVTVRVLRQHRGDLGFMKEGETYETSRTHAAQLGALVEIVPKAIPAAPANKAESAPPNKAERPAANKSSRAGKAD